MSQVIEDVAVARDRLSALVNVGCHVQPGTQLGYTLYAADNRVTINIGDWAGEVTLFLRRDQLTRFIAVLVRAGVELGDSIDSLVGGA